LGEWLFAHHLSSDDLPPEEEYFDVILRDYVAKHGRALPEKLISQLPVVRSQTSAYLDNCMLSIDWEQYSIVGFSCTFAQNMASLALAKRIKEAHPHLTIVFGGANTDGEMGIELHRQYPFIDFVCSGEGDWLFPEFVQRLSNGDDVTDLPGLIYRDNGETISNGEHAKPFQDLDDLPIPIYDDFFEQLAANDLGFNPADLKIILETSRGCWWGSKSQCTFCGLNNNAMVYRSKSADRVIDEFTSISERYPQIKRITLADNILDMHFFREVIPRMIETNLDLTFWYEVKANLNKEQLLLLKQAGIDSIQPGIESLDTSILKLMRKGCTLTQNVQLLKWAHEVGIYVDWNLISGFPGEDEIAYERMAALVPVLSHLQPPTSKGISHLRLDRFSQYHRDPESFGMTNVRPVDAYRFVYPFPDESLTRMAYYFDYDYADERNPRKYAKALDDAIVGWHEHRGRSTLMAMHSDERLTLYDSRPNYQQREIILEGFAREIYEFCDEGKPLAVILRHLEELGKSQPQETVLALLDEWVESGLMLDADNRYLSLAISMDDRAHSFIDDFINVLSKG
jgi:ribosomal peptide maturation radical SAM protein 1